VIYRMELLLGNALIVTLTTPLFLRNACVYVARFNKEVIDVSHSPHFGCEAVTIVN